MDNINTLREFYRAIKSGENVGMITVIASSVSEFETLFSKAQIAKNNIPGATFGGIGQLDENGFTLRVGKHSAFHVLPHTKRKKGVSETSKKAYKELSIGDAVVKMVRAALVVQSEHKYCTDLLVSVQAGESDGWVSARRNTIEDAGYCVIDNIHYTLHSEGAKKNPTGRTAQAWSLQREGQQELF